MGKREDRLAVVRARLERVETRRDLSAVLDRRALVEARHLTKALDDGGGGDLEIRYVLGWLHWYRSQALPAGPNQYDLDTAVAMFTPCFLAGTSEGPLPQPLLPHIADRAAPEALARLEHAISADDDTPVSVTTPLLRRVLAATPPGHPGLAARLSNLGLALRVRFERTGALPDLEEAVDFGREAVAATPPGSPNTALYLDNLGRALQTRFGTKGTPADLEGAVDVSRRAVAATPTGHRSRALHLNNLGLSLRVRFERTGALPDLEEAIGAGREAVAATPPGRPDVAAYVNALGLALQARFQRTGALTDLEEAIDLGRRTVAATATGHRRRALYLNNLGLSLRVRFERTGALPDLEEAVDAGREAVAATPAGAPDRALYLSTLGVALQARFGRTAMAPDLDAAIDVGRESVAATSPGHPNTALYLNNLSHALRARYERTGTAADLDEAVDVARESVAALPTGHVGRALYLHNLAASLYDRFRRTGVPADLDEAIGAARLSVTACPSDHPGRALYLSTLGLTSQARFGRTGEPADLDEAVDVARESVAATPSGHPSRVLYLSNLGVALQIRFERRGARTDLDEAIDAGRTALAATPADHPRRVLWLSNLGAALQTRFGRTGELADLDEAVDAAREAVTATSTGHPDRARYLVNLAGAVRGRFGHVGALADGDEAVDAGRQAVAVTPLDHPDRARHLSDLGVTANTRFERTGEPADLDEAIDAARESVAAAPIDHPDRSRYLGNLGVALHIRFERTGEPADLDEAIGAAREAVGATPADHPVRAVCLNNLASALLAASLRTGEPADLEEAVESARAAVAAAPADHPDRAVYLKTLGRALRTRYERAAARADREAAMSAFEGAARVESAPPSVRIDVGRAGAALAARSDPARAARLLEDAVLLLPTVAPRRLERGDQQYAVGEFAGLAADAAALTLAGSAASGASASERAVRALQLLEAGRAVLLSQALETRDDLTDLRQRHPDLATRFTELRELLDRSLPAAEPAPPGPAQTAPVTDPAPPRAPDRRRLAERLAALVDQIRGLEGFSSFARPPTTDELLGQAAFGPVVTFNVSSYRSDALILTTDGITALELPDLTLGALTDQVKDFHQALRTATDPDPYADRIGAQAGLRQILRWLWKVAAEPVLRALGHLQPPADDTSWPRVWWAPGGLLGLLPLHAAGHHSSPPDPHRRTVMDRVVSSYTPTISALRHARRRSTTPPDRPERALIVAMPTTPGLPGGGWLANVSAEATMLAARLPHSVVLSEPGDGDASRHEIPTKASVLAHLADSAIAHFACHGQSESADPSKSMLLLHDHQTAPLNVAGLAAITLDHARLAYLSACSTAVSHATRLIDESIHLASAFQLAGYPHVIGTLWEISDQQAVTIADIFYTGLTTGDGALDTARSAYALHHAVRTVRDTFGGTPSVWAAYLHAGA
ncbi:MAG: CHAT domain-containing protein [Actinoallomurus sp.]